MASTDWPASSFDLASVMVDAAGAFATSSPDPIFAVNAVPLKATTLYKNRGVNAGALIYWVSLGQPNPTPPGGLTVTDYCWELLAL